jgi:hypothetical protein
MNGTQPSFRAFTVKADRRVARITTPVMIGLPVTPGTSMAKPEGVQVEALWDTGATTSVITKSTATALGLVPTGTHTVHHAGGTSQANGYTVSIALPNGVGIRAIQVSECPDTVGGFGAIIGMNVITMGDLSISNVNSKTWMTFRIPSTEAVDFVEEQNRQMMVRAGRNDPCPCGSGKKFKKCHGA